MMEKETEIKKVLEKIRPYLQRDGGDVQFVKYEDGYVYVRMYGACMGCMAINDTLELGIEAMLMEEVDGIKGVRLSDEAY